MGIMLQFCRLSLDQRRDSTKDLPIDELCLVESRILLPLTCRKIIAVDDKFTAVVLSGCLSVHVF